MLVRNLWFKGAVGLLFLWAVGWGLSWWLRPDPFSQWLEKAEPFGVLTRSRLVDFRPTYRKNDCLVRFDFKVKPPQVREPLELFWDASERYIAQFAPKVAYINSMEGVDPEELGYIFARFAHQCPRRFRIARKMAAWITKTYLGFTLTVTKVQPERYDAPELDGSFWIDDPFYVPVYWDIRRRAYGDNGSGRGLLAYAQWMEKEEMTKYVRRVRNNIWIFAFASLAAERLPPGQERKEALRLVWLASQDMNREEREEAELYLRENRELLRLIAEAKP